MLEYTEDMSPMLCVLSRTGEMLLQPLVFAPLFANSYSCQLYGKLGELGSYVCFDLNNFQGKCLDAQLCMGTVGAARNSSEIVYYTPANNEVRSYNIQTAQNDSLIKRRQYSPPISHLVALPSGKTLFKEDSGYDDIFRGWQILDEHYHGAVVNTITFPKAYVVPYQMKSMG